MTLLSKVTKLLLYKSKNPLEFFTQLSEDERTEIFSTNPKFCKPLVTADILALPGVSTGVFKRLDHYYDLLVKHNYKMKIRRVNSGYWNSTLARKFEDDAYRYPDLVEFENYTDIKEFMHQACPSSTSSKRKISFECMIMLLDKIEQLPRRPKTIDADFRVLISRNPEYLGKLTPAILGRINSSASKMVSLMTPGTFKYCLANTICMSKETYDYLESGVSMALLETQYRRTGNISKGLIRMKLLCDLAHAI